MDLSSWLDEGGNVLDLAAERSPRFRPGPAEIFRAVVRGSL